MWRMFAAVVLWAGIACGVEIQEPPDSIDAGDDLDLVVEGMDAEALKTATVTYWPEDGVRCRGIRGWSDDSAVEIAFRAVNEGRYKIHVCAVANGELVHDEVIVTVGPQVGPLPGKFLHTVLVVEKKSGNRTGYIAVVGGLEVKKWLNEHGQEILIRDLETKDPVTESVPKDLAPWIKMMEGKSVPHLFFISEGGELVWEGSVPASEAAFLKLVQDYTEGEK